MKMEDQNRLKLKLYNSLYILVPFVFHHPCRAEWVRFPCSCCLVLPSGSQARIMSPSQVKTIFTYLRWVSLLAVLKEQFTTNSKNTYFPLTFCVFILLDWEFPRVVDMGCRDVCLFLNILECLLTLILRIMHDFLCVVSFRIFFLSVSCL